MIIGFLQNIFPIGVNSCSVTFKTGSHNYKRNIIVSYTEKELNTLACWRVQFNEQTGKIKPLKYCGHNPIILESDFTIGIKQQRIENTKTNFIGVFGGSPSILGLKREVR